MTIAGDPTRTLPYYPSFHGDTPHQVDLIGHDNNDPEQSVTLVATTNSATGAFDMVSTCPVAGKKIGALDSYTATATELHLFESSKMNEVVLTKK